MGDRQFRTYDTSALQPKRSKGPMIAFIAVIVVVALLLILGVSTLVRGCTSGNLVADGQQAVARDVLLNVIVDRVLVEAVALDEQLGVKPEFEHGFCPP